MINDILIFKLAVQRYGLPVEQVVEVVHMVAITALPDLPAGMLGVINYRGDVIPLLDLRQALEVPAQKVHLSTPIVIARTGQRLVGLLVDLVEGVATSEGTTQADMTNKHIRSITKIDDKMILMVNLDDFAMRV